MDVQDILALTLAAGAGIYVFRALIKTVSGRRGCGCGEGKSCGQSGQASTTGQHGLTRRPLVSVGEVGKPFTSSGDRAS